jgi:ABC-type multidrug transport system fused ATPase/permease subunit
MIPVSSPASNSLSTAAEHRFNYVDRQDSAAALLRQLQVDLDPQQLRANGLSGNDVVKSIGEQNLILPAGTQKIDSFEYFIKVNASPTQIDDLNNLPVRAQNGTVTYVHDVAHVRDGYAPQTNMVRVDGRRAVLMNVLKTGNASTIDIIDGIKQKLPQIRASLPPELKIAATSDQSVFVRSAIDGVIREAVIAAALTGLLILLFLGSWCSTLIITISIPLSILASHAQYDEQVAAYRNTVLTAYQEVEDNLAALRQLEQESLSEAAAVTATGKALEQARYRYKAGLVTYLEVATTETIALQAQQTRVNILNRRMDASVLLVKALGGGWRIDALAKAQPSVAATRSIDVAMQPPAN